MDLKEQIMNLLRDESIAARDDLMAASEKVAEYAAEQAEQLAEIIGEEGFELAVIAARDNVLMQAGVNLVAQADASDARFVGLLQGAISLGARALS